jgi:hypothetical protein
MTSATYPDHIQLIISRAEVEAGELQGPLSVLQQLATRDAALQFMEGVAIAIDGYNDDPRQLFEIPEVRDYVGKLDAGFPYWLFFLTKTSESLWMILLCFVPPCLKPEVHSVEGTRSMCD